MEEFKLPEKWCIKVNNINFFKLSKWINEQNEHFDSFLHSNIYLEGYVTNRGVWHLTWSLEIGPSITSELFERYVLKKEEDKPEPEKAMRHNEGKPKWSYVHFKSFEPMVRVLEKGAIKYAPHDWKKGLPREQILESMQRHLAALMDGEFIDEDLNLHHIGNIMCNAMFYSYHFHDKEMKA